MSLRQPHFSTDPRSGKPGTAGSAASRPRRCSGRRGITQKVAGLKADEQPVDRQHDRRREIRVSARQRIEFDPVHRRPRGANRSPLSAERQEEVIGRFA